jgi:hypothetical protein
MVLVVVFSLVGSLSAAGCDDAESIGCDWFSGANCWKESVAAANTCLSEQESGVFNGDRTQCTYPDGSVITFATPVPSMSTMGDYVWDFSIDKGGSTCASFRELGSDGDGGFELVSSLGTFTEKIEGTTLRISCPTGGEYKISAFDALECGFGDLPGQSWSVSSSVSYSLIGVEQSRTLFRCDEVTALQ